MNRREFLSWLGLGSSVLLIDPKSLIADSPAVEVSRQYPKLFFTGFKKPQTNNILAGQFLWTTQWVATDGEKGVTHWFCTVVIDPWQVKQSRIPREMVRMQMQNGLLSVVHHMDQIIADAENGMAQTGRYHQIANPDFDPTLPPTNGWDDDDDAVYNPPVINGDPLMKNIRSLKFKSFDEDEPDAWDFEKQAALACLKMKI